MSETAGISISGLSKSFGETTVLRDISLEIEPGSAWSLLARLALGNRRCCAA